MTAVEPSAEVRRRPGWMTIPGGPKEPNFQEFRTKITAINAKKTKLFDRLKEIQASAGPRDDGDRKQIISERNELKIRLSEIDQDRKQKRDERSAKNEEIARIRRQRAEIEAKLKELSNELGQFRELSDIEMAIEHIMTKMETGAGGLASEKRTIKKLAQLEEAKGYLLQLQPLQEAISESDDREAALQQEYREIHERIGALNKEYDEHFTVKQAMDKEAQKTSGDRSAIIKERDEIRKKINALNEEMTALRDAFTAQKEAWEAWRVEAMQKYQEKIEAERKERQKRLLERQNAEKIARKKARALKRQNPYEAEINVCTTLIRYLKDRQHMSQRDEEERKRRAAMATFDPASCAPAGFTLPADIPVSAKGAGSKGKGSKAASDAAAAKARVVQHNEEKMRLFGVVGVDAPMTLGAFDKTVEALKAKQQEYEKYIKAGELEISSDDEEAEEAAEEQPNEEAAAQPAA